MNRLHVAVLMGGPSAEREVSMKSGAAAIQALRAAGMYVSPVEVRGEDFLLPTGTEVAFLALHGTFGEDGQLQRLLDQRGVAYTGSGATASCRAFDKALAKEAFVAAGIPTPLYVLLEKDVRPLASMQLPLVVKPARQGSSFGVTIVQDRAQLEHAVEQAWRYGDRLVVEQFVSGREFTVGILDGEALPVVEIRTARAFFDFEAKYNGDSEEICPAELDPMTTARAQKLALQAHECLGCRDYSRVDIMLDAAGALWVLEVNTLTGLTPQSLLPKAAQAAGVSMTALCSRMVSLAAARRPVAVAA